MNFSVAFRHRLQWFVLIKKKKGTLRHRRLSADQFRNWRTEFAGDLSLKTTNSFNQSLKSTLFYLDI